MIKSILKEKKFISVNRSILKKKEYLSMRIVDEIYKSMDLISNVKLWKKKAKVMRKIERNNEMNGNEGTVYDRSILIDRVITTYNYESTMN